MPKPLERILAHGYFPKELPPPFNSKLFGEFSNNDAAKRLQLKIVQNKQIKPISTKPVIHNLARAGTLRRKLSIPNPIAQYQVTDLIVKNWSKIKRHCKKSSFSLTTPIYRKHGERAIIPKRPFQFLPRARIASRVSSRYFLSADLSQFYPSIYTHSISWAIHSKTLAKEKPWDYSMLGNLLDLAIRNGQDRQTIGIPIGPDTSLVIAELILSSIDTKIGAPLSTKGYRYVDDYGCGFRSLSDAEAVLNQLQQLVAESQLELNPRKTFISTLPIEVEAKWVPHLRLFPFHRSSAGAQSTELLSYFGRVFELFKENPSEAIIRYSVRRMRSVRVHEKNWGLYENLLLQCATVEPGTTSAVIGELYRYQIRMPINKEKITECLCNLIEDHSAMHHGSEVVWALWGLISLNCKFSSKYIDLAISVPDSCVALCALDAIDKNLVLGQPDLSSIEKFMSPDELYGEQWLLCYEANFKGWLPNIGGVDYVAADTYFSSMKQAGVTFYDPDAIGKEPVIPTEQDEILNEFDDLIYDFDDVSNITDF